MKRTSVVSSLFGLSLLAAVPARAEPLRLSPTVGLAVGLRSERLRVRSAPLDVETSRQRLDVGLEAGLSMRLPWRLGPAELRSQTQGALGLLPATGELVLGAEQQLLTEWHLSPAFSLQLGLAGALQLSTRSGHGLFEVGVPLGLRLGVTELLYVPAFVLPIGARQQAVLGGESRQELSPGLAPGRLVLRWRLGGSGS
ncbi:MAG TPA: hypothetical protein VFZ09_36380 [Archangium sp.]|uniref:hypothetical protein n=1 Tax=Archangium sp. TaxID=1872627 RepID=UPI002E35B64D|nr:hypothetical protein [Archangium sp.]HEX5751754.1 hypothetical protein [Archangium sp.]